MYKHFIFSCIFSLIVIAISGQTWVTRFGEQMPTGVQPWDTIAGVLNIIEGASGDMFAIARINREPIDRFYRIDTAGKMHSIWDVGHPSSGIQRTTSQLLLATPDSGCIIVSTNEIYGSPWPSINTSLSKAGKNSTWYSLEWQMKPVRGGLYYYPTDIALSPNGGYYVLFPDSLVETNDTGQVIMQNGNVKGGRFFVLPGGDFIVLDAATLKRVTLGGVVAWSIPCTTNMLTLNQGYVLGADSSVMFKINILNGSTVWSYPCPFSNVSCIDKTPGGGFVASCGIHMNALWNPAVPQSGDLFEVDAAGNVSWSQNYPLPEYGLNIVVKRADGRLATGGSYKYMMYYPGWLREFSAFAACVDSVGEGLLPTTTPTWPGDANFNDTVSFLDDVLNVALAFGSTGPRRDDSLRWFEQGWKSSFAADWPTSFPNGLNHKHADCNGDGMITTADFDLYANFSMSSFGYMLPPMVVIPPWRLSSTTSIGNLDIVPERDTVTGGDNIRFYLVAGSAGNLIDSIYGLALITTLDTSLLNNGPTLTPLNSDFGNAALNLTSYDFVSDVSTGGASHANGYFAILSRTDHQNVYSLGDTIAEINMLSDSMISSTQILNFQFTGYSAITWSGSRVILNPSGASVVINPGPVGTTDLRINQTTVFPNPAHDVIYIRHAATGKKMCRLYDALGQKVREWTTEEMGYAIQAAGLANGVYSLQVEEESKIYTVRLVIQR